MKKLGQLPPFRTIGKEEQVNVLKALKKPLSGYIGGYHRGGYWCHRLEREWEAAFRANHAVACNSATSGLLAACMAAGIGPGDHVWVTPYSMSATAACARILGAKITFIDIEGASYNLNPMLLDLQKGPKPKALIVTNLFGHPASLLTIRAWCNDNTVWMIEDNAQAPFASTRGMMAGTIGDFGVFSLNIHKHIQCGEGGVVVCRAGDLATNVRDAVNHGELRPGINGICGLNMRMTETTAAIACAQLKKGRRIVADRIEIAETLSGALGAHENLYRPYVNPGDVHVYYLWALRARYPEMRDKVMRVFSKYKFPIRAGYSTPLDQIFPHTGGLCGMSGRIEQVIMVYENCGHAPTKTQLKSMCEIIKRAGDAVA